MLPCRRHSLPAFALNSCALLFLCLSGPTAARSELVGWWALDGDLLDSSGQGNDGTMIGDPTFDADVPGALGSGMSMDFDGDDAIDLGNPAILDFGVGDWTISAWAKKVGGSDRGNIYSKGGDNGGGIRTVLAIGETGTGQSLVLTTDVDQDTGAKQQAISTSGEIGDFPTVDDEWNHVLGMRSGDEIRVYLNGVLADTTPLRTDPPYDLGGTSQLPAYIGVGADAASDPQGAFLKWFTGKIDDVAIWNEALSDDFIAGLASGVPPGAGLPDLFGDFNADGTLDLADYEIMLANFYTGSTHEEGNMNLRGTVDLEDFRQFREAFNAAGGTASVPEPSALALLFLGIACLVGRAVVRRR